MDVLRIFAGALAVMALGGCSLGSDVGVTRPSAPSGGGTGSSHASTLTDSGRDPVRASGPEYPVASLVDGDTIKVLINGHRQSIRFLGIDTPETKKPNTPVECFGEQASAHMAALVSGRSVQLVEDPSQGNTDKYGRLLRYVFVGGQDVGLSQVAGGYAREYTYDTPYLAQRAYRQAQAQAQSRGLGTWGSTCRGFHLADGKVDAAQVGPDTRGNHASMKSPVPSGDSQTSGNQVSNGGVTSMAGGGLLAPTSKCQIKGNISGGRKLAHVPGDVGYARTKITPNTGERWFCSVADAEAAGWMMAK